MTLENLQNEMIKAMKNSETVKKNVLSGAIGAIKNAAIAKKCKDNITEGLVNEVLLKEKKTIQEQIDTCPVERTNLLEEYKERLSIITQYCPKLMDDPEEIRAIVIGELAAAGIESVKANKGVAMKTLMPIFKRIGADMKVVNQIITEELE